MTQQNGSQKTFVNLAAASDQNIITDVAVTTVANLTPTEAAINVPCTATVPNTNVKLVSPYTSSTTGSINLTISNGAVNLRPPCHAIQVKSDVATGVQRPTLLRANISGSGALQRLPFQNLGSPAAINLKLNPINVRLAGTTTIAPGSKAGTNQVHMTPHMLRPLTLRPLTSTSMPTLTSGTPITLRPVCSNSANQPIAPMPIMQAVPQNIAAHLISQGSTALIQAGAKITNSMPIGQLQYMSGQPGQMGKLQMRPLAMQPIKIRPAIAGDQRMIGPLTMTPVSVSNDASSYSQLINLTSLSKDTEVKSPTILSAPSAISLNQPRDSKNNSKKSTSSVSSKEGKVKAKRKDSVKTKLASKEAPLMKDEHKKEILTTESASQSAITENNSSGMSVSPAGDLTCKKEVTYSGNENLGDEKSDKILVKKEDSVDGEADEEDGLVWKDGIGTLQGSDIRFRKNEFGLLEMITEDPEEEQLDEPSSSATSTAPLPMEGAEEWEEGRLICCCENCGIHGLAQEFLNGGRFCSRRCVGAHASKKSQAQRKVSQDPGDGPVKRKKRKLASETSGGDKLNPQAVKIKTEEEGGIGLTDSAVKKAENSGTGSIGPRPKSSSKNGFSWPAYLDQVDGIAAPEELFTKYQATNDTENHFKIGMRLEGNDPKHPALYCVLSVAEVRGFRVRLHFDSFSDCYDFWSNADSPFLFPIGWSLKHGKLLQPPKNYTYKTFNWQDYLKSHKYTPAPEKCFKYNLSKDCSVVGFQIGQKLEAVDKKNSTQVCVASVADMLEDHVLIHFDGWEDIYDYWCDPSSPYIHPVGWCEENQVPLSPPKDWKDVSSFTWEEYLDMEQCKAVPASSFVVRPVTGFEIGHRLEVIDRRNQVLIRAATIVDVESHAVVIHFDGWSDVYDYTVDDDSPDLHPCGWCHRTGHPLCPPLTARDFLDKPDTGCPTPGCTGVGHIKGAKFIGHHSAFGCPYSNLNMNKETSLHDRMGPGRPDFENGYKKSKMSADLSPPEKKEINSVVSDMVSSERTMVNGDDSTVTSMAVKPSKPLFGKGSGRGRKKTIVRLMHEAEQARQARTLLQNIEEQQQMADSLQQDVHSSVFAPSQAPSPYRDLPLGWEQNHAGLLPGMDSYRIDEVCDWDPKQVAKLIGQLPGCAEIADSFLEEQIDGESLLLLNQADMVRVLNIKLGPALKIYNAVLLLKNNTD